MPRRTRSALRLHPEVLKKNGRKEFVVLPYEEFVAIQEQLEDAEDLVGLRLAVLQDKGGPGLTVDELKARLGLSKERTRRRPVKRAKQLPLRGQRSIRRVRTNKPV